MRTKILCILVGCCLLASWVNRALADPPKPSKTKSLDDELLKGLGEDPLADKPVEKKPPATSDAKPGEAPLDEKLPGGSAGKAARPDNDLDKQLLEGLGEGEDLGAENPLVRIGKQMKQAGTLIGQSKTGDTTQELQKRTLADIERLIKLARQQQSQQSSASKQQQQTASRGQPKQSQPKPGQGDGQRDASNKPAKESTDRAGKAGVERMDPSQLAEVIKRAWGNLPEKDREQMLQNGAENFLPKYELLIEGYFKALAERQENQR